MLKLVSKNPYRVLGVYSNASTREVVSNQNKLKAYLKVGKNIKFASDFPGLLPSLTRTIEGLDSAVAKINLPKDRILHSLFWFIKVTSIDEIALGHLEAGNISKCLEILSKKDNFSSIINRSILLLSSNNIGEGIQLISRVIHDDELLNEFISCVTDDKIQISQDEVSHMYIDALIDDCGIKKVQDAFSKYGETYDDEYINDKMVSSYEDKINELISETPCNEKDNPSVQYLAGQKLIHDSKNSLTHISKILGKDSTRYQIIADKLSQSILQCGINYYNNTEDEIYVQLDKALEIQEYALKIAVGYLAKERCRENVDILKKKKEELPPKEVVYYDTVIKKIILKHVQNSNSIQNAIGLIKDVAPYLASIKDVLRKQNPYYLRISTVVVQISLSNVIDEFNETMNDSLKLKLLTDRSGTIRSLKRLFTDAWRATLYMDRLDMEIDFRKNRYDVNRESLKNQVKELIDISMRVVLPMKPEREYFESCNTIENCKKYLKIFPKGQYESIVRDKEEELAFDSCKTTQDCEKFMKNYPSSQRDLDKKWEDCYIQQCHTIEDYNSYLRAYPKGRYLKKANETIEKMEFDSCRTIDDYKSYLKKFPNAHYEKSANKKIQKLSYEACLTLDDYKKYIREFPTSIYYPKAIAYIEEEEFWLHCSGLDTKEQYRNYLSKYPNGRHKDVAEQKAKACYIATMVYHDYDNPQVQILRKFRDETLRNNCLGRFFIHLYYKYSPALVEILKNKVLINRFIKYILDNFIKILHYEN